MKKLLLLCLLMMPYSANAATFKSVMYFDNGHAWFYVYTSKSSSHDLETEVNVGPILQCYDNPAQKNLGKAQCFTTEDLARKEALKRAQAWEADLPKTHMTTTDVENWKKRK